MTPRHLQMAGFYGSRKQVDDAAKLFEDAIILDCFEPVHIGNKEAPKLRGFLLMTPMVVYELAQQFGLEDREDNPYDC